MRGEEAKAAAARAWRSDKKLYLALGAVGAFLLALRLVMRSRAASDFIVHKIVQPYHRAVGWLCGFVPFSVAELCWAVLVLFCIWYVGRTVWRLARGRGRRLAVLWRRALGGVLVALSVYTGFTLLWGLTYYAETFEEQAGVTARPVTVDELEATTRLFMEKLNAAAPLAPHAAPGVLSGDTQAIFDASGTLYDALEQQYPFLSVSAVSPKPMLFSRMLSALNFTGFFFPFTGEANLNVDSPECLLPATIAQLAHVRASHLNRRPILCHPRVRHQRRPAVCVFGLLLGISTSPTRCTVRLMKMAGDRAAGMPDGERGYLANNAHWQQFESPVSKAADSAYSGFLQSYDQELGSKATARWWTCWWPITAV
ncbi:MAG: DUF3810 family protein [Ruthenibacterium lactatiformans]